MQSMPSANSNSAGLQPEIALPDFAVYLVCMKQVIYCSFNDVMIWLAKVPKSQQVMLVVRHP